MSNDGKDEEMLMDQLAAPVRAVFGVQEANVLFEEQYIHEARETRDGHFIRLIVVRHVGCPSLRETHPSSEDDILEMMESLKFQAAEEETVQEDTVMQEVPQLSTNEKLQHVNMEQATVRLTSLNNMKQTTLDAVFSAMQ
ncbi:hypothetical protein O0I10_013053 [Lichtheimia ornata]|uniref:Uncharacterized protein n=1 Tax=Lichtheimia ornata TaxID=688661 RepID=A0AAD7US46_9FUNG|nr:uncharacterized protein O0I10_013053 [Lichtheimia ornata]KAJ8651405.1 hypothetical protein O0I10_013053 [Lichtheimia ornata]